MSPTSFPRRRRFFAAFALSLLAATLGFPHSGEARKSAAELEEKIAKMTAFLDQLQSSPRTRIPANLLLNAKGIVIMREFKIGFGLGAKAGGGVAIVRDPVTGAWSPPAFVNSGQGSYGFQIGGQKTNTVTALMTPGSLEFLKKGSIKLGVDLRATAGPVSGGGDFSVDNIPAPVLVYAETEGLFAGAAIEGGGIFADDKENANLYGVGLNDVLFGGKAQLTAAGAALVAKLNAYAGASAAPAAQPAVTPTIPVTTVPATPAVPANPANPAPPLTPGSPAPAPAPVTPPAPAPAPVNPPPAPPVIDLPLPPPPPLPIDR